jgi:hypothetical protein
VQSGSNVHINKKKKITSAASSQEKDKALHDEASLVALQQQVNMILSKN